MTEGGSIMVTQLAFTLGPVAVSWTVVTTWGLMIFLTVLFRLSTLHMKKRPGPGQAMIEYLVTALNEQIESVIQTEGWSYLPLIGTIFIFLVSANLLAVVPGPEAPTMHIETSAAIALIVFASTHYFGIRTLGLKTYLKGYTKPSLIMLPLNVLSELTQTFSLMIRLTGNIMSHELVIGVVLMLAGLFVPVPIMALAILIALVQAYIFTVLASVFIGAAINKVEHG